MILHVCMKPPVSGSRLQHSSCVCVWGGGCFTVISVTDFTFQGFVVLCVTHSCNILSFQLWRLSNMPSNKWGTLRLTMACCSDSLSLFFSASFPETLLRSRPRGKSNVTRNVTPHTQTTWESQNWALFNMLCSHLLTSAVSNTKRTNTEALTVPKTICFYKVLL